LEKVYFYYNIELLKTVLQVEEAIQYLKPIIEDKDIDIKEFEKIAGVGIEISEEEISQSIKEIIKGKLEEIIKDRYLIGINDITGPLKLKFPKLKWADGKIIMKEVEKQLFEILGPKTKEDDEAIKNKKPKKKNNEKNEKKEETNKDESKEEKKEEEGVSNKFISREVEDAKNPEHLIEFYKKNTKGHIRTRFPPEVK
jgi:glutaminyl-tRNA synthetase